MNKEIMAALREIYGALLAVETHGASTLQMARIIQSLSLLLEQEYKEEAGE